MLACAFDDAPTSHSGGTGRGWVALRSADDGETWAVLSEFPAGADGDAVGSEGNAITEITAPDGRPRLVAAAKNGVAVSDDGGASWQRSGLWGAFRWYVTEFAQAAAGSPAARGTASAAQALGDTLFATGRDFSTGHPVVLASADGVAWEVRHAFDNFSFSEIAVGPDGALWVGIVAHATARFPTVVWRSGDGGRTWSPAQDGYDGRGGYALLATRDGRMYLGGGGGVWRTNDLFATAADDGPPAGSGGLGLRVYPNPTGGRATVALALPAPGAVRLAVYDARGREALAVHGGAARDGQRFTVDTSGLAPGVYVMRVASASGSASVGLTVVR